MKRWTNDKEIEEINEIKDLLDETVERLKDYDVNDETHEKIVRLVASVHGAAEDLRGFAANFEEDEDYDPDEELETDE